MKRILKESDLFKIKDNKKSNYDRILKSLEATQKVQSKLDKILDALSLEEIFPKKKITRVSNIVSDLKKGDIIIKRGTKNMGEIVEVNDDSLIINIGGKKVKVWRQEVQKVV
ncbi:unnamed protein product [marine sediment metagenome]|uniref:Uncharacterized protein n=1 Tax=marine sediment metagenome TaxID=412755 RepID=X1BRY1_9ZZZZ